MARGEGGLGVHGCNTCECVASVCVCGGGSLNHLHRSTLYGKLSMRLVVIPAY